MRTLLISLTAFFLLSHTTFGQCERIRNNEIASMVEAGLSESVIILKIDQSVPDFDLTTDGLISLKKLGVSEGVLTKMLEAGKSPIPAECQTGKSSTQNSGTVRPEDDPFVLALKKKSLQGTSLTNPGNKPPTEDADPGRSIKRAKTIAFFKSSLHPSRQSLEKALLKRDDWKSLGLLIVRKKQNADLYVEIGFVSLSWITHKYSYRVYDRRSGVVLTAGVTTSWGSLSKNLARSISKNLKKRFSEAGRSN